MTMKKKLLTTLSVVLILGLAALGILAYLTDRDSQVNTFTVGDVSIDLIENFDENELMPGVALTKEVTIKNTGANDAYVWYTYAIPKAADEYIDRTFGSSEKWSVSSLGNATINGEECNVYVAKYSSALTKGATTHIGLKSVALDEFVDYNVNDGKYYHVENGTVEAINYDFEDLVIYVNAYAIQKEDFANIEAAYAAFVEQWGEGYWTRGYAKVVETADDMITALANGESVALSEDIDLEDKVVTFKGTASLDLGGNTLSGVSTAATTSCLINVESGATATISNGTVSFYATTPDTEWGGTGQPPYPGYANNTIKCLGTLIIDGATIENRTAPGGASYAIDCYQGSNLIVNSGTIDGQGKCAIRMFCNSNTLSTNVTINGGTITGKRAIWVQLPGNNIANVRPVNLTITGGELICTNTVADVCIYSYSYGDSFEGTNITISGGTFTGDVCFGGGSAKTTQENVVITGGTFYGNLGRYLADDGWVDIAKP